MSKHTQGEWNIDNEPDEYIDGCEALEIYAGTIPSPQYRQIAYVVGTGNDFNVTKEDRANARLIAAAPKLLEALEAIVGFINPNTDLDFIGNKKANLAMAKAAIAAAKVE